MIETLISLETPQASEALFQEQGAENKCVFMTLRPNLPVSQPSQAPTTPIRQCSWREGLRAQGSSRLRPAEVLLPRPPCP